MRTAHIEIKRLRSDVDLPERATIGSAGYDLAAMIDEPITLAVGECRLIPTGLAIHIKDKNIAGIIVPRSKRGAKGGLVVGNLAGIIDSDYQGEWFVAAWNRNFNDTIVIQPRELIAQALFVPVVGVSWTEVSEFQEETERKDGGIGKNADTKTI